MRFTKSQGVSFFAAVVCFAVFSVAMFVMPIEKNVTFWLAYLFGVYALVVMSFSILRFFKKRVKEEQFLNIPIVILSWIYLIVQLWLSYCEVTTKFLPYSQALTANLIAGLVFTVLLFAVSLASNRFEKNDAIVTEKVFFIQTLKATLLSVDSKDAVVNKRVAELLEEVTYSDPMSHSMLAGLEEEISKKTNELCENQDNSEKASELCEELSRLLKKRNSQCLSLKKVKEAPDATEKADGGNRIAIIGIGVALLVILATLTIVFYVIPESDYRRACEHVEKKEYEEAVVIFKNLGDYKDSPEKIEEIQNAILRDLYEEGVRLMEEGKYDEAIEAFELLGDFEDSPEKIEEINRLKKEAEYEQAVSLETDGNTDGAISAYDNLGDYKDSPERLQALKDSSVEEKYQAAEEAFGNGDYALAVELYYEVAPYKDSRDRIVEIYNRLSSGPVIYIGTYQGAPVAWRIVKMDGYEKMLLLADQPIRNLPISDDITFTTFADSDIAKWLNGEFVEDFTDSDLAQIINTDGLQVFLLSEEEVNQLKKEGADLSADSDWWLRSESNAGFKYATTDGKVESAGDIHFRDKGVRPAIWINLK